LSPRRQSSTATNSASKVAPDWVLKVTLMLLGPLLFFAALELALRVGGYGHRTDFFVADGSPDAYRTNPRFTSSFFPASFGLKPLNFRLSRQKPSGTHRVFVIGESAAMGVPEPGFGLAPHLRAQLQAAYPEKVIEVYNLGVTAINSHVLRVLAKQVGRFEPDVVVLYLGNNEFVGPYSLGPAVTGRPLPRPLIRLSTWLTSTRTGQLVASALPKPDAGGDWRGMEMFLGHTTGPDDPRIGIIYDNFAANLNDMLRTTTRSGAKVVLCTVAVNIRDSAPFASVASLTPTAVERNRLDSLHRTAQLELWQGRIADASESLSQWTRLDPQNADGYYLLGDALDLQGKTDAARHAFITALELDALRFRATPRINAIIRTAAEKAGDQVRLVDAARLLGSDVESSSPPAGNRYFFEHVHLNREGNHALARAVAPEVGRALFAAPPTADRKWLDSEETARVLGYTPIGALTMARAIEQLTARPPFTAQTTFVELRTQILEEIGRHQETLSHPAALADAVASIEQARLADPQNAFLNFHAASAYAQAGNAEYALALNRKLAEVEPASAESAAQRAFLLLRAGRPQEALDVLTHSVREEPHYFQTYELLAAAWTQQGKRSEALAFFQAALETLPKSLVIRSVYARLLLAEGRTGDSMNQLRELLKSAPDNSQALDLLDGQLTEKGAGEEALEWRLKAYAYNPRNYANNARLQQLYEARGDVDASIKFMRALGESGPVRAELYLDLALSLAVLNRHEEAWFHLWQAHALALRQQNAEVASRVQALIRQWGQG
jgi:tetratricopeptide (TPR) repeat protein